MKGLRILIALVCFGLSGAAFYFKDDGAPKITISEAVLSPMGPGHALVLNIDNPGWSEWLLEVSTDDTGPALLGGGAIALPAYSTPSLAMDGLHAMVMGLGDLEDGRLVPIRLNFERAGEITARARVSTKTMMDHGSAFEVPEGELAPTLNVTATAHGRGWIIKAVTENFTFSSDAVDGPHQSGIGHGHLYLNGLKLQRLYENEVRIGALPAGKHEIRVTLNTNDHRAFSVNNTPVSATAEIVAD